MIPDQSILRELKLIDRKLDIRWDPIVERWGIYHDAPLHNESFEDIAEIATVLMTDLWKKGVVCTRRVCEEAAFLKLQEAKLVFYWKEDDGAYRSLDHRIVIKMQRMDHYRRTRSVADWSRVMQDGEDAQKALEAKTWSDFWAQIEKDRAAKQYMKDAVQGDPHIESINISQPDRPARYSITETLPERKLLEDESCGSSAPTQAV